MSAHVGFEELDDYLHGGIPDPDAEQLEERLFAAAAVGEDHDPQFLDNLQRRATWLAAEGQFGESYTGAEVEALLARESNIHRIELTRSGDVELSMWKPDIKRIVVHLVVDLREYEQVEITAHTPGVGEAIMTFRGVQPDPVDGSIYAVCMEPLARMALTAGKLHWRVTGQRSGKREQLTEYSTLITK
jgi:hypothetical protein